MLISVLDELSLPGKFQNIRFFGGKLMFLEQRVENHFWRTWARLSVFCFHVIQTDSMAVRSVEVG